jgi:hypothetical protein
MIVHEPSLAAWLGDKAEQCASAARIEAASRRLRGMPFIREIEDRLEVAQTEGPEAILALVLRALDAEGGDAPAALLRALVGEASADPFFRPPFRALTTAVQRGLLLVNRPGLMVQIALIDAEGLAAKRHYRTEGSSVTFGGEQTLFRFLSAGGATLAFWEVAPAEASFGGAGNRCRLTSRRRVEDGETFILDGRRETFIVEHAPGDILFLQAATRKGAAPLAVEYDSRTLEPIAASSTDDVGSRVQMMLSLLRVLERTDAAPIFAESARNGPFHLRWHAMREFLALDAGAALPHLRAMAAADSHPEVREAARSALAAFFEPQECEPCPA